MTRSVVITGCSGAIGQALCAEFRGKDYSVIGIDKTESCDHCARHICCDLARVVRETDIQSLLVKELNNALGDSELEGLVNNAAVQTLGNSWDIGIDEFTQTLNVNLVAPFYLSQLLLERLRSSNGSIINIGSIHANLTKPKFVAYATSKAALKGLSQSMAIDLAEWGVRVNLIQPGATRTAMLEEGFQDDLEKLEKLHEYQPLKRIAEPIEIAKLASYLLSEEAGFITGSSLTIDGGISVRLHDPE